MPTLYDIREQLEICLPNLRDRLDDTKTLAELGLDSIDLVDLFCFIQSEYGVDPATVRIGPDTRVADLLTALAERTSLSRIHPRGSPLVVAPGNAKGAADAGIGLSAGKRAFPVSSN